MTKRRNKKWLLLVLGVVTIVVLTGYLVNRGFFGPPVVVLQNESGIALSNIKLSGVGFQKAIHSLEPSEITTVIIAPKGESGISISFQTPGKTVSQDCNAYIEPNGGYYEIFAIDEELKIKRVSGGIGKFFLIRVV